MITSPNQLSTPCQWTEHVVGTPLEQIESFVREEAVNEHLYPGALDGLEGEEREFVAYELYDRAVVQFGFVQARSLEIGLVATAISACEATWPASRCNECPVGKVPDGLWQAFDDLREQALKRGITEENFLQIVEQAQRAVMPRFVKPY